MQTLIQVLTNRRTSLRDAIVTDEKRLTQFGLKVTIQKKPGRSRGWAKLHSTLGAHGAVNIQWDAPTKMLICRVITRGVGKPDAIIASLIQYLIAKHHSRIEAIHILPR